MLEAKIKNIRKKVQKNFADLKIHSTFASQKRRTGFLIKQEQ